MKARKLLIAIYVFSFFSAAADPRSVLMEKRDTYGRIFQIVVKTEDKKMTYSIVRRDKNGKFIWSVDTWERNTDKNEEMGFVITVDMDGKVVSRWPVKLEEPGVTLGLYIQKKAATAIINLNPVVATRGEVPDFEDAVAKERDELLSKKYYPKLCGILAFLKVMGENNPRSVNGSELIALITKKESDFPVAHPKLATGIGQINDMVNGSGRVKVKAHDEIKLDKMRMAEDSEFTIVRNEETGNMKVVVEHGITVKKLFKFSLSYIELEAATGYLTFYVGNNTKRVLIDEILNK